MALTNVTQEILRDAEQRSAAIRAEAAVEIEKIKADADVKIAEMKEREDKKLKDEVERLKRQEVSSSELESKKIVLAKKKEILTEAFEKTLADLENAPADVKLAQYKAMVEEAKKVIANPKAVMSENDSFTAADLGVSEVVKDGKIRAGLILQSEDGQVEVDMQYATLLQGIWDREIKSVSDILFG
jgi:V/A-type H+-transporting ATPase subunit E